MTDVLVSIAVCTRNRVGYLEKCLEGLEVQTEKSSFETLIVDNGSEDSTREVSERFCQRNSNWRYFYLPVIGLSHARNLALYRSQAEWITYIDDDAVPEPDFVSELLAVILGNNEYDVIGGTENPILTARRPKWMPSYFYSGTAVYTPQYASGFNVTFRKTALMLVDGFDSSLGMRGSLVGYGEEVKPQLQIIARGGKIKIFNSIKVRHHVSQYKLSLRWQLMSSFAKGRDHRIIFNTPRPNFRDIIWLAAHIFDLKKLDCYDSTLTTAQVAFLRMTQVAFNLGFLFGGLRQFFGSN